MYMSKYHERQRWSEANIIFFPKPRINIHTTTTTGDPSIGETTNIYIVVSCTTPRIHFRDIYQNFIYFPLVAYDFKENEIKCIFDTCKWHIQLQFSNEKTAYTIGIASVTIVPIAYGCQWLDLEPCAFMQRKSFVL